MQSKAVNDAIVVALGPFGSAAASLGLVLLLSWSFDPQVLAIVSIIELVALFFVMTLTLGFDQAYVREYAESPDRTQLFASAMTIPCVLCVLSGLLILLILQLSHKLLLPGIDQLGNIIAITYGMSSLFIRLFSSSARMSKRSSVFSALQVIQRPVTLIAIAFCLIYFATPNSVDVIVCYLIGSLSSLVAHAFICRKEITSMTCRPLNLAQMVALFRFGWPTAIGAILYALLSSTDRISLAFFGTDYDLGVYSVAVTMAGAVGIFTLVFNLIWAPMVYAADARGADRNSLVPYMDIVVVCVFLAASLIAASAWLARGILPLEYIDVVYYAPACMSLPVLYVLAEAFGIGIALSRKTGYVLVANAVGASVAVLVSYILVPSQGASGAAFAVLAGSLAFLIFRTELSAMLWYEYPRGRMYIATAIYCSGCVGSLWIGAQLGWLFPIFWLLACAVVLAVYFSRLPLIVSTIQDAIGRR